MEHFLTSWSTAFAHTAGQGAHATLPSWLSHNATRALHWDWISPSDSLPASFTRKLPPRPESLLPLTITYHPSNFPHHHPPPYHAYHPAPLFRTTPSYALTFSKLLTTLYPLPTTLHPPPSPHNPPLPPPSRFRTGWGAILQIPFARHVLVKRCGIIPYTPFVFVRDVDRWRLGSAGLGEMVWDGMGWERRRSGAGAGVGAGLRGGKGRGGEGRCSYGYTGV